MPDNAILSIWERVLQSGGGALPAEVASYILRLGLPESDRSRMTDLSEKAQDGTLTEEERAELEAYSHAAAFLTVLQSKARVSLRSAAPVTGNGTPAA
jgi:hypothetical protein